MKAYVVACFTIMLSACSTNYLIPTETSRPTSAGATPTKAPYPSNPSTSTPQLIQIPTSNPIWEIPLNTGAYWVYEVNVHNDQDTATYCCITQTVISNQTQDGYFSAKVEIDRALNLEKGATELSNFPNMSWAAPAKWSFWYIIKDNRVYLQSGDAPDLTAVEEVSALEYVFPLSRGLPCWHPDPYDRNGAGVGHCVSVAEGPTEKLTPAGWFTDCYLLIGKGAGEWFCNGIGGVESELAGATESFSGVITLIRYYMAQP